MLYTLSILHLTRSTPAIFLYTAIILIFPPYNIILQQAIHRVHSQSFGPTSVENTGWMHFHIAIICRRKIHQCTTLHLYRTT